MNYSDYFEKKRRKYGPDFVCLKEESPSALKSLVESIHKGFDCYPFPNDWIYWKISEAFLELELDPSYVDNIQAYVYTPHLIEWLKEPFALNCCTEWMEEFGNNQGLSLLDQIRGGTIVSIRSDL